jgi:hypothetical protein
MAKVMNDQPICLNGILKNIHSCCEDEKKYSLAFVAEQFSNAIRTCSGPTTASSPSLTYFPDWIARRCGIVESVSGNWTMVPLDFFQVVKVVEKDDTKAYHRFWEFFNDYCHFDERLVGSIICNEASESLEDNVLLRCNLVQLYPESGVYLHFLVFDKESIFRKQRSRLMYFDSIELAKAYVYANFHLPAGLWSTGPDKSA